MALINVNTPWKTLRKLGISVTDYDKLIVSTLLRTPPAEVKMSLQYFKSIREDADKLYTLALRISQVAATAMECIEPGSSNKNEPSGGETKEVS